MGNYREKILENMVKHMNKHIWENMEKFIRVLHIRYIYSKFPRTAIVLT